MNVYQLNVSCTMGYNQACELRRYLKEKYGANATILKIEENIFSKQKKGIVEYCKFTGTHGTHETIIQECKKHQDECVKLYPCAFFIAYSQGINIK